MRYQIFDKLNPESPIDPQIFTESEILGYLAQLNEPYGTNFSSIEDFNNWDGNEWFIQAVDNQ
jgi:hypothetical protein